MKKKIDWATLGVTFLTSLVSALMLKAQQKVDIQETVKETLREERRLIYEAQKRSQKEVRK